MGARWYYLDREQKVCGPLSLDGLIGALRGVRPDGDALVWTEGMERWAPARERDELRTMLCEVAPSEPPAPPAGGGAYENPPTPRRDCDGGQRGIEPSPASVAEARAAPEAGKCKTHPWRRFFARQLDLVVNYSVWTLLADLLAPDSALVWLLNMTWYKLFFAVILLFPVEAGQLRLFGSTLGKRLYAIRIEGAEGRSLNLRRAIRRSWDVVVLGFLLGIPFLQWLTISVSYLRLKRRGVTMWDQMGGFVVRHDPIGWGRVLGITAVWGLIATIYVADVVERRREARAVWDKSLVLERMR